MPPVYYISNLDPPPNTYNILIVESQVHKLTYMNEIKVDGLLKKMSLIQKTLSMRFHPNID